MRADEARADESHADTFHARVSFVDRFLGDWSMSAIDVPAIRGR